MLSTIHQCLVCPIASFRLSCMKRLALTCGISLAKLKQDRTIDKPWLHQHLR